MPEDPELAVEVFDVADVVDDAVDPEILVVPSHQLDDVPAGPVVEQEVLEEVHQLRRRAGAPQHGVEAHAAFLALAKALPRQKVAVGAGERADARVEPVAQDDEGVVVEDVRYGVLVVAEVVFVGVTEVFVVGFEFEEDQRQPVDEADDVGTALVDGAFDFELPNC